MNLKITVTIDKAVSDYREEKVAETKLEITGNSFDYSKFGLAVEMIIRDAIEAAKDKVKEPTPVEIEPPIRPVSSDVF